MPTKESGKSTVTVLTARHCAVWLPIDADRRAWSAEADAHLAVGEAETPTLPVFRCGLRGTRGRGTQTGSKNRIEEPSKRQTQLLLDGGCGPREYEKVAKSCGQPLASWHSRSHKPVHRVGVGSSMSKDTWMPLPVEGYLGGGEPEKEKGGEDGDWRPPRMDPKLQSLLRHCALELWVPLLEAEVPKAVANFDTWLKLGEECTRDLFQEILESLYEENEYEEKLPKAKLEKFIGELYPKKQKKGAKAAPPKLHWHHHHRDLCGDGQSS